MVRKGIAFISLFSLCMGFQSCDNGCEQVRETYPQLSVISTSGCTMRNMDIYFLNDGQLIAGTGYTSFDKIAIDINPKSTSTTLIINSTYSDYGDSFTVTDTVTINYTVEERFLDLACGCTVDYEITDATTTHNLFRRIDIKKSQVTSDADINLTLEY